MPKRYLNAQEKSDTVKLLAYNEGLEDVLKRWQERQHDKKLITAMKYARTYLDKLCNAIFEPLDRMEVEKILAYAKKIAVSAGYTEAAKKEYETMMKMDSVLPVETEDFYEIAEQAVEICNKHCKKNTEEQGQCRLRNILMRYDVPVADMSAPEGKCPYQL